MRTAAHWFWPGLLSVCLSLVAPPLAGAQTFSSGSTGADGPFNPTSNTTLTLPPNGVFNFTTINVPTGVTVTFSRNAANTPVSLLATGAVTLTGTLSVDGGNTTTFGRPGPSGPGGFDGGAGADGVTTATAGFGLGPGGGGAGSSTGAGGGGGGYGLTGGNGTGGAPGAGGAAYGGSSLRPILGGSGGGGGGANIGVQPGGGGGGGGGAIVVASSTSITINGTPDGFGGRIPTIRATGGNGSNGSGCGGGGSGGGIRVIAPTITGYGQLLATGGYGGCSNSGNGATGRIRVEATTLTYTGTTTPLTTTGLPQPVFPATGQPNLAIASVGGIPAPATPSGSLLAPPDILLPTGTTNPVEVVLTASNVPLGTAIQVTATPQAGSKSTATSTGLSGSLASSTATASLMLSLSQTSVLTASATFTLVACAGDGPIYADGEEVTHVKVAAVLGGPATITYLTRSGREVAVH